MSTQRGNVSRTRAQKHENKTVFKNNLHDTSHMTKFLNNIQVTDVCPKCKSVIEWKIKYKKYKPLKAPGTCVRCHLKSIKHAYHTWCLPCAKEFKVCPKCGLGDQFLKAEIIEEGKINGPEIMERVKGLSERRRRAFHRFTKKKLDAAGLDWSNKIPKDLEVIILTKLDEMCISSNKSDFDFDDLSLEGSELEDDDESI